jgi:lysozyme
MTVNTSIALSYAAACVNGSEGFSATAYLDKIAKPPVWTIGHGTTRVNGKPVVKGMTCTKAQADAWSAADMSAALGYVLVHCDVPLNDCQASSLCSLCYNIGMGNFRDSTVIAALNEGDYRAAADCFLEYDHAGGKQIAGLTARRERERAMFLSMMPALPVPMSESDALNQRELDKA